jgi:hypothetical protein
LSAEDVLKWAASQVGEAEDPPGSNKIKYWPEIGLGYLDGFSWCGTFGYRAFQIGHVDLSWTTARRFVDTPAGIADAKRAGIFYTSDPRPGDPAWVNLDNDPGPEHVVIVREDLGSVIKTYEGNVGNRVQAMTRRKSQILGYARLTYLDAPQEDDVQLDDAVPVHGFSQAAFKLAGWSPVPKTLLVRQSLEYGAAASIATLTLVKKLVASQLDYEALGKAIATNLPDGVSGPSEDALASAVVTALGEALGEWDAQE